MEWPASLDEYEKLVIRMNTPRVVIDNAVCSTATLVKVDSARQHCIHLEAVQVLADLNLSIRKAYITSDGRWFMDVFHVTDHLGRKLTDDSVISYLEQSLNNSGFVSSSSSPLRADPFDGALTALELTGTDRLGLLSEVFAVLADLRCSIVEAKAWTHGGRIAALIFLKDAESGSLIDDSRMDLITARLRNVLNRDHDVRGARTTVSSIRLENADRRLHQMMFADGDYGRRAKADAASASSPSQPSVSVQNWIERGYSVVSIQCRDRAKLLFDVVCTLTDMEYVVFHGTIDTNADRAHLEFYIRHKDGTTISSEAERQTVIQCLQAAIERRSCEGLRLDLCAMDRQGLLAEVTRTFRENGLSILRAEISTKGSMAINTFYVTDACGHPADLKAVNAVVERIGPDRLKVVGGDRTRRAQLRPVQEEGGVGFYYLGSIVRRNLYNLGLIRSCS